jgi:hypothetical protein
MSKFIKQAMAKQAMEQEAIAQKTMAKMNENISEGIKNSEEEKWKLNKEYNVLPTSNSIEGINEAIKKLENYLKTETNEKHKKSLQNILNNYKNMKIKKTLKNQKKLLMKASAILNLNEIESLNEMKGGKSRKQKGRKSRKASRRRLTRRRR